MNTPAETPSNAAPGPHQPSDLSNATPAESESARLKEITAQLAEDVRPLVDRLSAVSGAARPLLERARPMADVFAEEMRPLFNDLRPVARDLRALLAELLSRVAGVAAQLLARLDRPVVHHLRALLAELLARAAGRAAQLPARLDLGPVSDFRRIAGASARRLATTVPAPRVTPRRPPSIPIGSAMRSIARRLRPGRWAFRTTAVGIIALVVSNSALRDGMVEEISWTRSMLQTIELPTVELPSIELPTIQFPAFEFPTIHFGAESAAPPKLKPAQFELPPLSAYRATFETQASYPTVPPNATVEWVVALRNTGSVGWYRGVAGAQAGLALTDGTEVAVQTTAYVAPGQVGWFIARFRAPAGPGTHSVALFPRIDGRGELPDLGILALVTVR